MNVEIGQADWLALAHAYGEVLGELAVYKRVCGEQGAEIERLRHQLVEMADELHKCGEEG